MALLNLKIDSIEGFAGNSYSTEGFDSSIAIDPDFPIIGNRASGQIVPVGYSKVSSTALTSTPLWHITTPKTTYNYVYCSDGRFLRYDADMTNETLIGTVSFSHGNGAAYYNNYIYLASDSSIARYGPLDGAPSLTGSWWPLTALSTASYPSIRSTTMPNHPMFVLNGKLFVCDTLNGQGIIHKIVTKKTTAEGDTDNGSAYNVLDLPFGYFPNSLASNGTDLVISALPTSSSTSLIQGKPNIFFWDTVNPDDYYKRIPWDDPLITLGNSQGKLYAISGNTSLGVRVSQYLGGDSFQEIAYVDDSLPPFMGAIDSIGSKLAFGGFSTSPAVGATVYSVGSKNGNLKLGLHNIAKTSSVGSNPLVTSLLAFQQDSFTKPKFAIGWRDGSTVGIDTYSASATLSSVFRKRFQIGRPFKVNKIYIPLGAVVASNMQITAKVYVDDDVRSQTLPVVNSTNYSGVKLVKFTPTIRGEVNTMLELTWGSTTALPVTLPITIIIETVD